jgi:uncharacterized NAD(P)/FAD-binding protein YdhS
MQARQTVIVVGGGASGVLLACHLLRAAQRPLHVTLVEKRETAGRGLAYSTPNPSHVLNVRAQNMSAFPDRPDHFWQWMNARESFGRGGLRQPPDSSCFAPRSIYGDYLADLIEPYIGRDADKALEILHDECISLREDQRGVTVHLKEAGVRLADIAVLATGHPEVGPGPSCYADPWMPPSDAGIGSKDPVLILGTGLTMVDYVLALQLAGHVGPIFAMSRRGLLPQAHRLVRPLAFDRQDIPFDAGLTGLTRWIRDQTRRHVAQGGDWRIVVDGLRPYTQTLWQNLSLRDRKRFLEHARAWWDAHRHRMAPDVARRIDAARASGRLKIMAAKLNSIRPDADGVTIHYRRRGKRRIDMLKVKKIIECKTASELVPGNSNRLLKSLFDAGTVRTDPFGLGIDVTQTCAVISRYDKVSDRLFAVGPLTRSAFWEIVAIPDIRNQCAALATTIRGRLANPPAEESHVERRV